MPPIVYLLDSQRINSRRGWLLVGLSGTFTLAFLAFLSPLLDLVDLGALPRPAVWGVVAVLVGVALPFALAPLWVVMFPRPQGPEDGLRLDGEGLTLTRRGRRRSWTWSQVSEPRPHGALHPLALLRGRFVSLRVAGGSQDLAIGDRYLTPIAEIAATMARYRGQTLGLAPRPARGVAVRGPRTAAPRDPVMFRRAGAKVPKQAMKNLLAGGASLLISVGVAAAVAAWRADFDWAALAANPGPFLGPAIGGLVAVLLFVSFAFRRESPGSNFLLLSDDGLLQRTGLTARRWPWRDLADFALQRPDAERAPDGEARPAISFTALGDGSHRGGGKTREVLALSIEEHYDRPPQEILRELAAWHARALESQRPAAAGARDGDFVRDEPPSGTAPRGFRWGPKGGGSAVLVAALVPFLAFSVAETAAFFGILHFINPAVANSPNRLLWLFGLLGASMLLMVPVFLFARAVGPAANSLMVDAEGLTYRRLGLARRWPWDRLPAFEVSTGRKIGSKQPGNLIAFAQPKDDWLSRFQRWAYGIRSARPLAVIEDVYDVPLEEIARQLNDGRKRAAA